jgi:HEAT repeat protein
VLERALRWGTPVDNLIEAGLLIRRAANHLSFSQPAIGAYLAAKAMKEAGLSESASQAGWAPAEAAMTYYAGLGDVSEAVDHHLEASDDPLETNLLICARWLKDAPTKMPWRSKVLRQLATIASANERPYGLRLRAVHALAQIKEPSIGILFRRLLTSKIPSSRVLGALGLGGFQDEESIAALLKTLDEDQNLQVRQAVCLALAAIGTETAFEGLGNALLKGEEALRLAAAESLACNPDEGYNMLRDAIELDNLLTRRAAVFGLARVAEDWASRILETVQLEDDQWVVRGAAAEAVERRRNPPWKILPLVKEISDLPWLVEFAAKEGLGVAPGRAALEMLRRALNKGTPDEKIAAFEAIVWAAAEELGLEIHNALQSPEAHLRDAAYEALWRLNAAGIEVPTFVH